MMIPTAQQLSFSTVSLNTHQKNSESLSSAGGIEWGGKYWGLVELLQCPSSRSLNLPVADAAFSPHSFWLPIFFSFYESALLLDFLFFSFLFVEDILTTESRTHHTCLSCCGSSSIHKILSFLPHSQHLLAILQAHSKNIVWFGYWLVLMNIIFTYEIIIIITISTLWSVLLCMVVKEKGGRVWKPWKWPPCSASVVGLSTLLSAFLFYILV